MWSTDPDESEMLSGVFVMSVATAAIASIVSGGTTNANTNRSEDRLRDCNADIAVVMFANRVSICDAAVTATLNSPEGLIP